MTDWHLDDPQKSKENSEQPRAHFDAKQGPRTRCLVLIPSSPERKNLPTRGSWDVVRHIMEKAASFRMPDVGPYISYARNSRLFLLMKSKLNPLSRLSD
jgi:hypothetical protein